MVLNETKEQALFDADVLVVCTEWKAFWSSDFDTNKCELNSPIIIDGRNRYDPGHIASIGIQYHGVGRGESCVQHAIV
jgi:UDPglucose 6-dehydrogenase